MSISQPAERSTLVLLSGGLDSSALLFYLAKVRKERVRGVFVDFGQGNAERERAASKKIWQRLKAMELEGEPLSGNELMEIDVCSWRRGFKDFEENNSSLEMGYLPRNLLLPLLAIPYARLENCNWIAIGSTTEDGGMPDSNDAFAQSTNRLFRQMHQPEQVTVPWLWEDGGWDKRKIANWLVSEIGREVLELSWSCYRGGVDPCGDCGACKKRVAATEGL